MNGALNNIATFVIGILFDLAIFLCLLRILLQWHRAPFQNPVCQLVGRLTNPIIQPLANLLPRLQRLDLAALIVGFIIAVLKPMLLSLIKIGAVFLSPIYILVGVFLMVTLLIDIFFYSIIFLVVLSWLNPGSYNPVNEVLTLITNPIIRPIQRVISPVAGFDLSPIVALFVLKLIEFSLRQLVGFT